MNNSNSTNTPLHVVNFVALQSKFAYTTNLLFRGSINYTWYRFTFAALHAEAMNICVQLYFVRFPVFVESKEIF